jgi:hypothetical protein
MVQSAKKKKVSFNNLTPPGGRSSKEMATPVGIAPRSSEKRMPTIATPFKTVKEKTYVSRRGDGDYERDEEGRVIYGSEEMHGKMMDLGVGCEGVEENDITRAVMDILEKEKDASRVGTNLGGRRLMLARTMLMEQVAVLFPIISCPRWIPAVRREPHRC